LKKEKIDREDNSSQNFLSFLFFFFVFVWFSFVFASFYFVFTSHYLFFGWIFRSQGSHCPPKRAAFA